MACGAKKIPEMALTTVSKNRALKNTKIDWTAERGAGEGEEESPDS